MREGTDDRAVLHRHAGAEHDIRLDGDVAAEFGIARQKYGFRCDQSNASVHRLRAQTALQHRFGLRELRLGVDAAHVVLRGFDGDRLQSHRARDGNRVGQIKFALAVVIADSVEQRQRVFTGKRHQPAIAEADRALLRRCIFFLDDSRKITAGRYQPSIAGRVLRRKAKNRHRRARAQRGAQGRQRFRPHQRRVGEHHQNIAGAAFDRLARRQHRMRGAEAFALLENLRLRSDLARFRRDIVTTGPHHNGDLGAAGCARRRQDMGDQTAAADAVQDLRRRGSHARSSPAASTMARQFAWGAVGRFIRFQLKP